MTTSSDHRIPIKESVMTSIVRTRISASAGVLGLVLVTAACSTSTNNHAAPTASSSPTVAAAQAATLHAGLRTDLRKLWEDHITWTRLYIIAAEAGAPDTDATAGRLLQNQTDIGNALKPLYGDAAGAQLTALLKQHILTAGALIGAAKAGDTAKVTSTKAQWYANGDQIAAFLTKANPTSWPAAQMRQMMRDHLDNTLAEAVDHLQGHAAADIADYDKVHVQILQMADMLTTGIVTQFPQQFS
jgi:hypothetical protein